MESYSALYQVEAWIQSFQLLCAIPMEQRSHLSLFCYLYHLFLQVPQNVSVLPYFHTLGLLHSGLSMLMATDCTGFLIVIVWKGKQH